MEHKPNIINGQESITYQKKHFQLSRECQVDQVKQTCQIVQHNQLSSRPPASRHLDQWKHNQFQENCHLDKRIVISTSCISSLWMSTGSPPPSLPLFSATCSPYCQHCQHCQYCQHCQHCASAQTQEKCVEWLFLVIKIKELVADGNYGKPLLEVSQVQSLHLLLSLRPRLSCITMNNE